MSVQSQQRDPATREALVRRFAPLARSLARRYERSSEPFEDLLQVAQLGLVKAIDRFDPDRGVPFPAFAVPTILGELKRHFRDCGWAVHLTRELQERALAVQDAHRRLDGRGRAVTVRELAQYLELTDEQVIEALSAAEAYRAESLDAPPPRDDPDRHPPGDRLGADDDGYAAVETIVTLGTAFHGLPMLERHVLALRFFDDLTQRQIGERIGVSQMQVSRLLRSALGRLRELIPADGADGGTG